MPSFDIEIKETTYTTVSIEAETLEEALMSVEMLYHDDEIVPGVTHDINVHEVDFIPLEEDWDGEDVEEEAELDRQEEQRDYEAWKAETEVERALGWRD